MLIFIGFRWQQSPLRDRVRYHLLPAVWQRIRDQALKWLTSESKTSTQRLGSSAASSPREHALSLGKNGPLPPKREHGQRHQRMFGQSGERQLFSCECAVQFSCQALLAKTNLVSMDRFNSRSRHVSPKRVWQCSLCIALWFSEVSLNSYYMAIAVFDETVLLLLPRSQKMRHAVTCCLCLQCPNSWPAPRKMEAEGQVVHWHSSQEL